MQRPIGGEYKFLPLVFSVLPVERVETSSGKPGLLFSNLTIWWYRNSWAEGFISGGWRWGWWWKPYAPLSWPLDLSVETENEKFPNWFIFWRRKKNFLSTWIYYRRPTHQVSKQDKRLWSNSVKSNRKSCTWQSCRRGHRKTG